MGKPSDRPEVPPTVVHSRQVALPIMLDDPLVPVLGHVDMPSSAQESHAREGLRTSCAGGETLYSCIPNDATLCTYRRGRS